jgi:hypothetical protein
MSQVIEEKDVKKIEYSGATKTLPELINYATSEVTFQNFQALCNQASYEVAGHTYQRKMLTPDDFEKLLTFEEELSNPNIKVKRRMAILREQAQICLDGVTDELWKKTDVGKMEIIIGACILISKGFRTL